jgi:hypothetical protein
MRAAQKTSAVRRHNPFLSSFIGIIFSKFNARLQLSCEFLDAKTP